MECQEIEVLVAPDGNVRIHVNGVKGMECASLTEALEQALGGETERELTWEAGDTPGHEGLSEHTTQSAG